MRGSAWTQSSCHVYLPAFSTVLVEFFACRLQEAKSSQITVIESLCVCVRGEEERERGREREGGRERKEEGERGREREGGRGREGGERGKVRDGEVCVCGREVRGEKNILFPP